MKPTVLAVGLAVLALLVLGSQGAEPTPEFSGTWKMDASRSTSAHESNGREALTLVIKQTATELSIETQQGNQSETIVYQLDGTETEKPAGDNGPFHWRAQWQGAKLMTETHRNINRSTVTIKEVLSLDGSAKEMTVDRTLTVQHGYTMRGAKNYSSGKDVFVKIR